MHTISRPFGRFFVVLIVWLAWVAPRAVAAVGAGRWPPQAPSAGGRQLSVVSGRLSVPALRAALPKADAFFDGIKLTQITDTVYYANGLKAQGTVLISWPSFTTALQNAVAAGSLTVQLGPDGMFNAALAPTTGSTPAGVYYSVVYQLNDGSSKQEYWAVPATDQTTISAVRAKLVPTIQAAQFLTRDLADSSYVHMSDDQTVGGVKMFVKSPVAPDPHNPTDVANKEYVDANAGQANLSSPPPIGSVTPNTGAFTTLAAKSVNGECNTSSFGQADWALNLLAAANAGCTKLYLTAYTSNQVQGNEGDVTIPQSNLEIVFGPVQYTMASGARLIFTGSNLKIRCPSYACGLTFNDAGRADNAALWLKGGSHITVEGFNPLNMGNVNARSGVYGVVRVDPGVTTVTPMSDVNVLNNVIQASTSVAIFFAQVRSGRISGNVIGGPNLKADGIHVSRGSSSVAITNNIINQTGDDCVGAVAIKSDDGVNTYPNQCNITIADNTLTKCGFNGVSGSGIDLVGGCNITGDGNTIDTTANLGAQIAAAIGGNGTATWYPHDIHLGYTAQNTGQNTSVNPVGDCGYIAYARHSTLDIHHCYNPQGTYGYGARVAGLADTVTVNLPDVHNAGAANFVTAPLPVAGCTAFDSGRYCAELWTNLGETAPSGSLSITNITSSVNSSPAFTGALSAGNISSSGDLTMRDIPGHAYFVSKYPSIQAAINAAYGTGTVSGEVLDDRTAAYSGPGFYIPDSVTVRLAPVPYTFTSAVTHNNGNNNVTAAIVVEQGAHLAGGGTSSNHGTTISVGGSFATDIIATTSVGTGTGSGAQWWHWGAIENLNVDGTNQTAGECVHVENMGETSRVRDLLVKNCYNNNIEFAGAAATQSEIGNLSTSRSRNGSGVRFTNLSGLGKINGLSGDCNAGSLASVQENAAGTLVIVGLKSEAESTICSNGSAHDPVVLLDTLAGLNTHVHVVGGYAFGTAQNAIAKVVGSGGGIFEMEGFYSTGYTNLLNDTVRSVIVPATSGNSKQPFYYEPNGIVFANQAFTLTPGTGVMGGSISLTPIFYATTGNATMIASLGNGDGQSIMTGGVELSGQNRTNFGATPELMARAGYRFTGSGYDTTKWDFVPAWNTGDTTEKNLGNALTVCQKSGSVSCRWNHVYAANVDALVFTLGTYTVATLPGSYGVGSLAWVNDGASSSDCTSGHGATRVLCYYTVAHGRR